MKNHEKPVAKTLTLAGQELFLPPAFASSHSERPWRGSGGLGGAGRAGGEVFKSSFGFFVLKKVEIFQVGLQSLLRTSSNSA